jgi:hypothetical protein
VSASVRWSGLDELKAQLRTMPEELTDEGGQIAEDEANGAADDIRQGYQRHVRSGRLARGVRVTHFARGKFSAGAIVKSAAPHAWIFENGTQARHTAIGANRGSMPPGHVFVPAVVRRRRRMYERLKELLTRRGLVVTGDAR